MKNCIFFVLILTCTCFSCRASKTLLDAETTQCDKTVSQEALHETHEDAYSIDMSKQVSVRDKILEQANLDIEEVIETCVVAATDSTPQSTITKVKRKIKSENHNEIEKSTAVSDVANVSGNNLTETSAHSEASSESSSSDIEYLEEKDRYKPPLSYLLIFTGLFVTIIYFSKLSSIIKKAINFIHRLLQ